MVFAFIVKIFSHDSVVFDLFPLKYQRLKKQQNHTAKTIGQIIIFFYSFWDLYTQIFSNGTGDMYPRVLALISC